jgi:hypothetical protein
MPVSTPCSSSAVRTGGPIVDTAHNPFDDGLGAGLSWRLGRIHRCGEQAAAWWPVEPAYRLSQGWSYLLLVIQGPAQVKTSALSGAIRPGDLLSSAAGAGYAARAAEVEVGGTKLALPGTVFGKALEALDAGQELTWVFVTLQ